MKEMLLMGSVLSRLRISNVAECVAKEIGVQHTMKGSLLCYVTISPVGWWKG